MTNTKTTPTYKVGDYVQSAPDSSDLNAMNDLWIACVMEVRTGLDFTSDGCCYVTAGWWQSEMKRGKKKKPTTRQLWAEHLAPHSPA